MKITRTQLKALIREQVAAVINETDWRDVSDPDHHKPQGEAGPYADFKEGMPEVAGLMSQAGAYAMPPAAMQRLMRVIKEFAPHLPDEELLNFAQQLIDAGALETALSAPKGTLQEDKEGKGKC